MSVENPPRPPQEAANDNTPQEVHDIDWTAVTSHAEMNEEAMQHHEAEIEAVKARLEALKPPSPPEAPSSSNEIIDAEFEDIKSDSKEVSIYQNPKQPVEVLRAEVIQGHTDSVHEEVHTVENTASEREPNSEEQPKSSNEAPSDTNNKSEEQTQGNKSSSKNNEHGKEHGKHGDHGHDWMHTWWGKTFVIGVAAFKTFINGLKSWEWSKMFETKHLKIGGGGGGGAAKGGGHGGGGGHH